MIRIKPHICDGVSHRSVETACSVPVFESVRVDAINGPKSLSRPREGGRLSISNHPATCLMRAIISSTALSTGILSLRTRFAAFAHTFSLLIIVNL